MASWIFGTWPTVVCRLTEADRLFAVRGSQVKLLLAVHCAVCALMLALPAGAQLDPGEFEIFQDGTKVGEIFVPDRTAGQTNYIEHWVLFSEYIYPGGKHSRQIEIKSSQRSYASVDDFLARVPWGPSYRYVRIEATDTDKLPNRVASNPPDDRAVLKGGKGAKPLDMPAQRKGKAARVN